ATLAILGYLAQHFEKHLETVVLRRKAAFDDVMTKMMPSSFTLRFRDFSLGGLQEELFGRSGDTLLIQATSAPLHGEDLRSLCPALDKFHGVVVDLVYGTPSRLLTMAKERGLLAQDGIPMLIEQARLSQQFWWQKSAPYEVIAEALGRQGYGL